MEKFVFNTVFDYDILKEKKTFCKSKKKKRIIKK